MATCATDIDDRQITRRALVRCGPNSNHPSRPSRLMSVTKSANLLRCSSSNKTASLADRPAATRAAKPAPFQRLGNHLADEDFIFDHQDQRHWDRPRFVG